MKERVSTAHRRADGALVVAISFVILGVAPLVSINVFAETLDRVFSPGPSAAQAVESPVELAAARLTAESQCLAEAMYYEALGEGIDGQKAVAEVILQRTRNRNYGNTVCSVVYEGVEPGRRDCQFSFACDGSPENPKEGSVWAETKLMAEKIMTGQMKLANRTQYAVSYHSVEVNPFWSDSMVKTVQIGNHVFYRFGPRNPVSCSPQASPQNIHSKIQSISSDSSPPRPVQFPKL